MNQTGLLSSDPLWLDHLTHGDDAIRSQESQNTMKFTHGKTMVKWQLTDILVMVNDGKSFELFTLDLVTSFQPLSSKNTTKEKRKMVEGCGTIYSAPGSCPHDSSLPHRLKPQTIYHSRSMHCCVVLFAINHKHTHMHGRTHAPTHPYTHTHTHAHTHTHTHTCTHTLTHIHNHTCTHNTHTHTHTHTHTPFLP